LPQPTQLPATEFSLHVPFATAQMSFPIYQGIEFNLKSQISNPKSPARGVKPYIAYHKLIFYA